MGEIIGGLVVVALFIAFVIWKNKGNTQKPDSFQRMQEEQYWAEKEAQEPNVVSSDGDRSDD